MEKLMTTLDNGGTPFAVKTYNIEGGQKAIILSHRESLTYEKMFDGNPDGKGAANSAILFYEGGLGYTFIGTEMYCFTTNEEIQEFYAPIGNSAVPYPVAVSENFVYFMLDKVWVSKEHFGDFNDWENAYTYYYEQKMEGRLISTTLSDLTEITGRVLHPETPMA